METLIEEELLRRNTTCLLKSLEITYCGFSRSFHKVCIPPTIALKKLSISHCSKLDLLLPMLLRCHQPFLECIYLCDNTCDSLKLSFSLSNIPRLRDLVISNLEGLEFLSVSISEEDPTSLGYLLRIEMCPDLVYIGLPAVEAACYTIYKCRKLKLLAVAQTLSLSSLESLSLEDCHGLLLQRDGLPSNLRQLHILSCNQLTSQEDWGLQTLNSLTKFNISGGCQEVRSFPWECLLPSTITTLEIEHLPNLKSLDSRGLQQLTSLTALSISSCPELESLIEAGLQHLTSLEKLQISYCLKLQYLTKERLPDSLSCLTIEKCPSL